MKIAPRFTLMPLLTGRHRAHHGEIMREATALADAGSLKPRLDPRTFTLDSVADAHAAVERAPRQARSWWTSHRLPTDGESRSVFRL
ncbi:zinc-binding dehydrogenase [Streptomyces sp. S1D4-11]